MNINPDFVDVDFSVEAERLGKMRGCNGMLRPGQKFRRFGEYTNLIPNGQWEELARKLDAEKSNAAFLLNRVYNQQQEGSCVGNATAQCVEGTMTGQVGFDRKIDLSAISIYKAIGSSPQSGAYVGDALERICDVGVLPLDTPENRAKFGDHVMPATGFRSPWPQGYESTAAKFRGLEFYEIDTEAEMMSALLQGFFVVVGREGHSIVYCAVVYQDGKRMFAFCNSWGSWGQAYGNLDYGFGFDTEKQMKKTLGRSAGAFALLSMVTPEL